MSSWHAHWVKTDMRVWKCVSLLSALRSSFGPPGHKLRLLSIKKSNILQTSFTSTRVYHFEAWQLCETEMSGMLWNLWPGLVRSWERRDAEFVNSQHWCRNVLAFPSALVRCPAQMPIWFEVHEHNIEKLMTIMIWKSSWIMLNKFIFIISFSRAFSKQPASRRCCTFGCAKTSC